jgi:hypothetical protein
MVGAADAVDAPLGRGGDLVEALAGQVGQVHALEARPQRLDRVEFRGRRRAAAPPPARTAGA